MISVSLENTYTKFILKIVDPYFENSNHFFYEWVSKMIEIKNVYLLSVYEPVELTNFISKKGLNTIIYAPYPYDISRELDLSKIERRSNRIIISGSVNALIYPFRHAIWSKSRRSISRLIYKVLKHPGYAEVSNLTFQHNYVGNNYIKYLANYKYMLVCGARCHIELLKFHECAYAGCLPVGIAPTSFPDIIKQIFFVPNKKRLFISTFNMLLRWSKILHEEKILTYRNYLRIHRSPLEINKSILKQLDI